MEKEHCVYKICAVGNLGNKVEELCVHDKSDHAVCAEERGQNDQGNCDHEESLGVGEVQRVDVLRPVHVVLVGPLDEDEEAAEQNSGHFDAHSDGSAFDFLLQLHQHIFAVFVLLFLEEVSVQDSKQQSIKIRRCSCPGLYVNLILIFFIIGKISKMIDIMVLRVISVYHNIIERS